MTLNQLEHAIRASCQLLGCKEIYVVGSQSILGSYPNVSGAISKSVEADVLPIMGLLPTIDEQKAADLVDGTFGPGSIFENTHKFAIDGVIEAEMTLPPEWRSRTKPICSPNTNNCTGHCLDPYDMAVAKLVAGRPKDKRAIVNLIQQGILKTNPLEKRIKTLSEDQLFGGMTIQNLIERLHRWIQPLSKQNNPQIS